MSLRQFSLAFLFALGVLIIWLPPRPPMVDLPQHAGQIGLLRDLILHRSPWAHEVRINLFTPYLIGYGLALPLAFVMPVAAAIKLVLTAAYAAFGAACLAIRRELGSTAKLDAYYFVSFFGFAYVWGMYTFLVAAPFGLGFIWLSIRYARRGGIARAAALAGLGTVLVLAHGLMFLFVCAIGLWTIRESETRLTRALVRCLPLVVPLALSTVIFVITRHREASVLLGYGSQMSMGRLGDRLKGIIYCPFGVSDASAGLYWATLAVIPLIGGFRLGARGVERLTIFAAVVIALAAAPSFAWSTGGIYQRFTLLLPPAYAWLFDEGVASAATPTRARVANVLSIAIVALCLAARLGEGVAFARETRNFDAVMARAEPGHRALSLVLDRRWSTSDPGSTALLHLPIWYQAEKHGFVDFNFAMYAIPLVQFTTLPSNLYRDDTFPWRPRRFDWKLDEGWRYKYFFVRHAGSKSEVLFAGAPCAPALVMASGPWSLYQSAPCASPRNPAAIR